MIWTKDKPTKQDWYWYREIIGDEYPVKLVLRRFGLFAYESPHDNENGRYIDTMDGEFSSKPIPQPEGI